MSPSEKANATKEHRDLVDRLDSFNTPFSIAVDSYHVAVAASVARSVDEFSTFSKAFTAVIGPAGFVASTAIGGLSQGTYGMVKEATGFAAGFVATAKFEAAVGQHLAKAGPLGWAAAGIGGIVVGLTVAFGYKKALDFIVRGLEDFFNDPSPPSFDPNGFPLSGFDENGAPEYGDLGLGRVGKNYAGSGATGLGLDAPSEHISMDMRRAADAAAATRARDIEQRNRDIYGDNDDRHFGGADEPGNPGGGGYNTSGPGRAPGGVGDNGGGNFGGSRSNSGDGSPSNPGRADRDQSGVEGRRDTPSRSDTTPSRNNDDSPSERGPCPGGQVSSTPSSRPITKATRRPQAAGSAAACPSSLTLTATALILILYRPPAFMQI